MFIILWDVFIFGKFLGILLVFCCRREVNVNNMLLKKLNFFVVVLLVLFLY